MSQKTVQEYLACVAKADALGEFIERTRENQSPKTVDGPLILTMLMKPFKKGWVCVARGPSQARQCPRDTKLVAQRQVMQPAKAAGKVKRGRPGTCLEL